MNTATEKSNELSEYKGSKASSMSIIFDSNSMEKAMKVAEVMAQSTVTVPKHLQGKAGDCMAVVLQAMNWGMNPFVVAQKTHVVNGTLGYEAQLVNAVVQSQGFISGTFSYEYEGEGNSLKCRVGAALKGSKAITWGEWLGIAEVKIKNSPLWQTNPKQQMGYLQVKNWTRAFCPAAILGVYTKEELQDAEEIDVTPTSENEKTGNPLSENDFNEQSNKLKEKWLLSKNRGVSINQFASYVKDKTGFDLTESQLKTIESWKEKKEAESVDADFVREMESEETK